MLFLILNLGREHSGDSPDNNQQDAAQNARSSTRNTPNGQTNNVVSTQSNENATNLPVKLSPRQISENLKNKVLSGSSDECKNMLAGDDFQNILDASPSLTRKERKGLSNKLDSLNSEVDTRRLQNVINALNKSDICSDLDLSNIIDEKGRIKDIKNMSEKDVSNLNTFIEEIGKNKDFIDDEQLEFLQNGFINNVRSKALSHSVKPKSIGDLFKKRSKVSAIKKNTSKLHTSLMSIPKEEPKPKATAISSFYKALADKTNDTIETQSHPPRSEDEVVR